MIRERYTGIDKSILSNDFTQGLGELTFHHPKGTFSLTPASNILFEAIINSSNILHGTGIDWGTGVGCQAILAAKISTVNMVYGLDISQDNIDTAIQNAAINGVSEKTRFMLADSYNPFNDTDRQVLSSLIGQVDFIVSNPPSSDWDDGFGFRRIVLSGAAEFLKKDGLILLNISMQYGSDRINSLCSGLSPFSYMGIAASTNTVPFDLTRPELLDCLNIYAAEEEKGGYDYAFLKDEHDDSVYINARTALKNYKDSGVSPLTKWQTHLFKRK